MAGLRLTANITFEGQISCLLESGAAEFEHPVICFSLMGPGAAISGGELLESLGGFCAVRLEGRLTPATPIAFTIGNGNAGHRAANRAWLPLEPYLRLPGGGVRRIEAMPHGVPEGHPAAAALPELALAPPPKSWKPAEGHVVMGLLKPEASPFHEAVVAADALACRSGFGPLIAAHGLPLRITEGRGLPPEGYRLTIGREGVLAQVRDRAGALHAAVTLIVLRAAHDGKVPCGSIEDAPRFGWRGQHLDCARHFYRVETILRLLDLMALLKLNRFHWHFSDDEAFRLEVDCFPELWRRSAQRGENQLLPGLFGGGAGPSGGSYSRADVRTVLERAKELGIEVLPEIEVPAHALAVTAIYPHLRDPRDVGIEVSVQGYARNTVNPALPQTWEFLERLSDEVASMFPFGHLHIGGDELPAHTWAGSPAVTTMKAAQGLKDHEDVFGVTMERLAQRLRRKGIRPCAWEEAARGGNGGIGNQALLFSWSGQGPGLEAARRGYDVVMCPGQNAYFDMAHTDHPDDWGATWAAILPLARTIDWDPVPADEPELERHIVGVQACFWGEFTTRDREMEAMLAPRIMGIATKAWSPRDAIGPSELAGLALAWLPLFDAMGWQAHAGAVR